MGTGTELGGRVAIVTGGGGGIAGAICRHFAAAGASVLVTDVNLDAAQIVAADIERAGGKARALKVDVGRPDECEAAAAEALAAFGKITTLVNAAATVTPDGTVDTLPLEAWYTTLQINLTGMFLMCRFSIPHMRAAGGGTIVNIASSHSYIALQGRVGYCTTKAGIRHFTRVLALDHGPDNIRVNSISPGPIDTERALRRYGTHENSNKIRGPGQALLRTGTVDEIAEAALFLSSDRSSFVTGTDLLVDGGQTAFKGDMKQKT